MNKNSKRTTKIIIFIIAVIAASILAIKFSGLMKNTKITKSGRETLAPQFSVKSINYPGMILSLKKFRGKIILINFWATWCPPCRDEMPRLEKFYKSHKKDGFVIFGLSVNNSGPVAVLNFIKTFKGGIVTYPIGMATPGISKAYGNIYEIPQSFIINRKGIVVTHFTGELPPGFLSYEFKKINKKI
ncbi:MAG TPA: TlpA family protein disulfide reductase [bacterium]|nr:TlpA family protein disulfide reductase [bacterium]